MDEHTHIDTQVKAKSPSFIEFWLFVASEIGAHRLDLNTHAKVLSELFTDGSVHDDYLKRLISNSLPNPAGNLSQPINLTQLLDSLGEVAFSLRQRSADDLFDIELLEEIAWHIGQRFGHLISLKDSEVDQTSTEGKTATLYTMRRYRPKFRGKNLFRQD